ncbi:sugar transferase [Agrococcus sp. DT81.2]|uniref:sugar transferase n=1 Tax=Agrococcus sp. DT81.2 TaxID=3393414 RepID=UPI003CE4D1CF
MIRVPYDAVKRGLDLVAAGSALVLLSPVLAGVGIAVAVNLGRPVLFRQLRPGRDGVTFELVKFRSMRSPDPAQGLLSDEQRLTPFGRALRATSLDELPSLWNVVKGDMSIVGPRPLLVEYLDYYTHEQAHRHDVRPGITGLAQASGRNALSWKDRLELDIEYVDKRSIRLDMAILRRTIIGVLRRHGVTAEGHATMPKFSGER